MAATYTPIASATLSATTASITFSNIPQTYTDLVLVVFAKSTGTYANFFYRVNSDSGSNYSQTRLSGNGTTASSARITNNTYFNPCGVSGISDTGFSLYTTHFMNYSNTTTNKTFLHRTSIQNGNAGDGVELMTGLWRNTAAINTIFIDPDGGDFASGTTANLYGILGANA